MKYSEELDDCNTWPKKTLAETQMEQRENLRKGIPLLLPVLELIERGIITAEEGIE